MSLEHLVELQQARAFDPVPPQHDLHDLHVPFDSLLERGEGAGWESALDAALRRGERVAVVGASGEGKSSLMAYVLGPLVEGLAPLPVPVTLVDDATVTDPARFATHLVQVIARYVDRALPKGAAAAGGIADLTPRHARTRHGFTVAPEWMGARLELTYQLQVAAEAASAPSGLDRVEAARSLIDLVEQHGLRVVLVLDDTDKWTRGRGGHGDRGRRQGFFGRVIRLIAEHLGCSAVVAVHPSYLQDEAYRTAAQGFLSAPIRVPRLTGAAAVGSIFAHREQIAAAAKPPVRHAAVRDDGSGPAAWSPAAVETAYDKYAAGEVRNLRSLLYLAHTTLSVACRSEAEQIEATHVDLAIRELAD
ncbi:MAG: hypothetical protein QOJ60_779 [Actinomycetota bacterium]|nr:hypothetical protein [Actinomycetota bacterium]